MDFSARLVEAIPQSLDVYIAIFFGLGFLWIKYFSHRAFLDIKRRELEIIKLAAEINQATLETKGDMREMTDRTLKELNQSLEAQTILTKRVKRGLLETIREGVAHYEDKKKCISFFIWGAGGACFMTGIIWFLIISHGSFTGAEYRILSVYGTLLWVVSVVFGGVGGILFAWNSKMQASLSGVMGAGLAVIFGKGILVGIVNLIAHIK